MAADVVVFRSARDRRADSMLSGGEDLREAMQGLEDVAAATVKMAVVEMPAAIAEAMSRAAALVREAAALLLQAALAVDESEPVVAAVPPA